MSNNIGNQFYFTEEEAQLDAFFLKKFSYLKPEIEKYLNEYEDFSIVSKEKLNPKGKQKESIWKIDPNEFLESMIILNQQKLIDRGIWNFHPIQTNEQYFRILDSSQSFLQENEQIRRLDIKIEGSILYSLLLVLTTLPRIKRVQKISLTMKMDLALNNRMKENEKLREAVNECQQILMQIILIRKQIEKVTIYINNLSSEHVCFGIAKVQVAPSHQLKKFKTNNLFLEVTSETARQSLNVLSQFPKLEEVIIGQVNLSNNETIESFNKILQKAQKIRVNFGELVLFEERLKQLTFAKKYQNLQIQYLVDELSHPEKLDFFLEQLSVIEQVEKLQLDNLFSINDLPYFKASTIIKETHKLRKLLPGSLILENIENIEQITTSSKREKTDLKKVEEWQFFSRLKNIKINMFIFQGQISQRLSNTLINLCKEKNVKVIDVSQSFFNSKNRLSIPLSVKRVFDQEADIDLVGLYSILDVQPSFQFSISYKRGQITLKGPHLEITTNHISNTSPQIFNPFLFNLKQITKLNLKAQGLQNLSDFELIFKSISQNKFLTFVSLEISFSDKLRKKITYNTLHPEYEEQFKVKLIEEEDKYLGQLVSLESLKHLVLILDFDQTIIDSVEYLLISSKSLQTVIIKRNNFQQYVLDFSLVIQSLTLSKTITHVHLDLQLDKICIIKHSNQRWFKEEIFYNYHLPIASLLEDHQCQLQTIEIQDQYLDDKDLTKILKSLLKKKNKTVLRISETIHSNSHPFKEAFSNNLIRKIISCSNDEKFISIF